MRVPSEFTIKGKLWKVVYKWRLVDDEGRMLNGLCDGSSRTVYLAHGLGEDKAQVFLHEYIHAVFFEYGFFVSSLTPDVEEFVCQILSNELLEKFKFRWKKCV